MTEPALVPTENPFALPKAVQAVFEHVKTPRGAAIALAGAAVLTAAGAALSIFKPASADGVDAGIAAELKTLQVERMSQTELNQLGVRSFNNLSTQRLGVFETITRDPAEPGCYNMLVGGGDFTPAVKIRADNTPIFSSSPHRVCVQAKPPI